MGGDRHTRAGAGRSAGVSPALTVLIVDDDPVTLQLLGTALRQQRKIFPLANATVIGHLAR